MIFIFKGVHIVDEFDLDTIQISPSERMNRINRIISILQELDPPSNERNEEEAPNSEEEPTEELCTICMDTPRDVRLLPCGHNAFCRHCIERLRVSENANYDCPLCRTPIEGVGENEVQTSDEINDSEEPQTVEELCSICLDTPQNVRVLPCGHDAFCRGCIEIMRGARSLNFRCPLCRAPIRSVLDR